MIDDEDLEDRSADPAGLRQLKPRHSMLLLPALVHAVLILVLYYLIGWHSEKSRLVLSFFSVFLFISLIPQFVLHTRYAKQNRGKEFWSDGRTLWITPVNRLVGSSDALELNRSTVQSVRLVARFALLGSYSRPLNSYYYWRVTLRDGRITVVNSLVHSELFLLMSSKGVIQETKWSLFSWY